MRYKKAVAEITYALEKYKAKVDELEKERISNAEIRKREAESHRGQWTDEYIKKYSEERPFDAGIKEKFDNARKEAEAVVLHYLDAIKKSVDGYFNAPVRNDFANKIMSVKLSGLQLTDREFQMFSQDAMNYMEYRLLKQLAEDRTREVNTVSLDENGTPKAQKSNESNPYFGLKLPNIDEVYNSFEEYERSARGLLYSYGGEKGTLSQMLEKNIPDHISMVMDGYLRNGAPDKFSEVMDKANSILPESKVKRVLTEQDKKFIDTLIDNQYPSLAAGRAKELAQADENIRQLLLIDERYSKYVEESEE